MNGGDSECMTVEELRQLIDEIEARCDSLQQHLDAGTSHEVGLEKALVENRSALARYRERLASLQR
jgi:plasmid stabilization system protein ParE